MTSDIDFTSALHSLTMREIQDTVVINAFSFSEKQLQSKLEEAVHYLSSDHHSLLADAVLHHSRDVHSNLELSLYWEHGTKDLLGVLF